MSRGSMTAAADPGTPQITAADGEKRSVIREAWRLAAPYWRSEDRWRAWLLLGAVIALNLANVYIDVRINQWNNAFFNAIQEHQAAEFFKQLGIFGLLAGVAVVI